MHTNKLLSNNQAFNGIYRGRLLKKSENDIRVFIPGIYNSQIKESDLEDMIDCFPKIQWCAYNLESIDMENQDNDGKGPAMIMFENGDLQRPVVLSYVVIGSDGSSVGSSGYYDLNGNWISTGSGVISGEGQELIVPDQYGLYETYEKEIINNSKYHGWNSTSNQYALRKKAIDSNRMRQGNIFGLMNCAIIDDRLLIATKQNIGGNFLVSIGDYLDIIFSDGSVWNCIVGDFKGADAPNPWGHDDGKSVIEIIYWDYSNNSGNQYKKVSKIIKVGNYDSGIIKSIESGNSIGEKAITWAKNHTSAQGYSYVYGADGPKSYDCSHYVWRAYKDGAGLNNLPYATTTGLYNGSWETETYGFKVVTGNVQVGDILIRETNSNHHVDMYLGNGYVIGAHSASTGIHGNSKYDVSSYNKIIRYSK